MILSRRAARCSLPLFALLVNSMSLTREQLELVVQKKKINEIYNWFHDHFIGSTQQAYSNKCPFVIIQGPAGCCKTTTLKCVANELKIPVKEYGDTTDTTAISYDMNQEKDQYFEDKSVDRRRALRFEHFVFNNLRFNPLDTPSYAIQNQQLARADSEFDDSDDDQTAPFTKCPPPATSGIIIHVESPLSFARSQKILISSIAKMVKMIREISRTNPRRIAIVFETLESDKDVLSLPTKFKQTIGMQVLKFNPIIRANMKKFIESMFRKHQNVQIDKDTVDALITDCDGDLQACINTLEIIRTKSKSYNSVYMGINDENSLSSIFQKNKRQRMNPERFKLNTGLMRDVTRSLTFFHVLGKIFYQKRLYPDICDNYRTRRGVDRPYKTENSTDYLVSRIDAEPKKLLPWLHEHYPKFCHESNIDKASLFLEHLSDIDSISTDSMQSSQFYEMHSAIDQIQLHLAIESTVFSLYTDQSHNTKSSHKKSNNHIIKSSVESSTGELSSFKKPISISVPKVISDHLTILDHCLSAINRHGLNCVDSYKILVDYIPYLRTMSDLCNGHVNLAPGICEDEKLVKLIKILGDINPDTDYDAQHESLMEMVEEIEPPVKGSDHINKTHNPAPT